MDLIRERWTRGDYEEYVEYLKSFADEKYKKFSDSLSPDSALSYGVRVPVVRKIAKEIAKGNYAEFLSREIGKSREEIIVSGLVMSVIKCGYPETLSYMKEYAERICGWETCDVVTFKGIKKYPREFLGDVGYFIYNDNPWAQRFGFLHLMAFYLTEEHIDTVLGYVDSVDSDFYYVQMMQAWLIATAAAKCRDKTIAFLESNHLNDFTQNKAIQKMRESRRVSDTDKEYAAALKRQI